MSSERRRFFNQHSETAAGQVPAQIPDKTCRLVALTCRLHALCERRGWVGKARAYKELQGAWTSIDQAGCSAIESVEHETLDI